MAGRLAADEADHVPFALPGPLAVGLNAGLMRRLAPVAGELGCTGGPERGRCYPLPEPRRATAQMTTAAAATLTAGPAYRPTP